MHLGRDDNDRRQMRHGQSKVSHSSALSASRLNSSLVTLTDRPCVSVCVARAGMHDNGATTGEAWSAWPW